MADFEIAYQKMLETQGSFSNFIERDQKPGRFSLCSECFYDEGLKRDAYSIGEENTQKCKNCKSINGRKLNKEHVRDLCYRFFVRGTIERFDYGGFPLIQFNEQHYKKTEIHISSWLEKDVKLIERVGKIGLFYYGPRFWMFGEIEPLKSLQDIGEREKIIEKIFSIYPSVEISEGDYFYRIRSNPETPYNFDEYDSAPNEHLGKNRFDSQELPILYSSPDLELCIHECRISVEDKIYAARLTPKTSLRFLNLWSLIEEDGTEFESLDLALHFLFLAGKHSYEICREIAKVANQKGFDGIIYPSYFSYTRTGAMPFETIYGMSIRKIPDFKHTVQSQSIPNLALFGRPIKENKIKVECVNKVIINRVSYETSFGPAYHEAFGDSE